jgi:GntR family transcriptional repressor for pyruvate dehydrogenase complex
MWQTTLQAGSMPVRRQFQAGSRPQEPPVELFMFDRMPVPRTIARKIQAKILSGRLKSGDRIPGQRELADQLGVSRASLREALLQLETIGLIKTEAGRGTFVVGKTPSAANGMAPWRFSGSYSIAETFQTRIMLEGSIASLVASSIDAPTIDALEVATDAMERCWGAGDLLANVEADLEFHHLISEACSNAMLRSLYDMLRGQITETQRRPIPITEPERMAASISEHRDVIDSFRRKDSAGARRAMEDHVSNTARCAGVILVHAPEPADG